MFTCICNLSVPSVSLTSPSDRSKDRRSVKDKLNDGRSISRKQKGTRFIT